jgi:23S rRNA U2552 (ribose-2'-O)-methylase RlmE/FtsJ
MMQQIAEEMHRATGALSAHGREIKVLDICMAPGGYTAAILKLHPNAKAFAITLPKEQGGHPLHIGKERLAGLQLLDVTMLATEFANQPIPKNHPERERFLTVRPFKFHAFDIVFCDGMVLRTQKRESHRESTEVTRLACSQLILALQRIKAGGTLIMLLHKIDSFGAANILYAFSKFANVRAFKPHKKHATRSSFYMIATNVRPDSEPARAAVEEWKAAWWKATFGGEAGTGEMKDDSPESVVLDMLEDFGEKLMEMGRSVWKIQADALSKTDYAGDGSVVLAGSLGSPSPVRTSLWSRLKENAPPQSSISPTSPSPLDRFFKGI